MSCRSLLLLVDQDPLCASRTQTAVHLAKALGAHLHGVAPTGQVELSGSLAAASSSAELATAQWETLRRQADGAARAFEHTCDALGLHDRSSVVDDGEALPALLRHTRLHDLTVLSQPDPGAPGLAARRDLVERTILFSARPTLLLPYAGRFVGAIDKVMVCWDGSRESARAVADAMPFLSRARQVDVVSWREAGGPRDDALSAQLHGICEWLKRHGATATPRIEVLADPIAQAILSKTADLDSDLLVMGAYGHSRWAERILGGATQGVLACMPVPVLMSH